VKSKPKDGPRTVIARRFTDYDHNHRYNKYSTCRLTFTPDEQLKVFGLVQYQVASSADELIQIMEEMQNAYQKEHPGSTATVVHYELQENGIRCTDRDDKGLIGNINAALKFLPK